VNRTANCMYCDSPSTLLCDFKLGWPIGELIRERDGSTWHAINGERPPHACDMPLCREHAENRGWLHIKAGRNSRFDSYDYCPEHVGMVDTGAPVIPDDEADRLRRAVHANARRRLMRERGALQSPTSATQGELF
jgi:hypothetical protein